MALTCNSTFSENFEPYSHENLTFWNKLCNLCHSSLKTGVRRGVNGGDLFSMREVRDDFGVKTVEILG